MRYIAILFFAFVSFSIYSQCTGSAYCTVCKNCSRCRHCGAGGVCGVCSPGSFKAKPAAKKATSTKANNTKPATAGSGTKSNVVKQSVETLPAELSEEIHEIVDQKAQFPGGAAAMKKYISSNIQIPSDSKKGTCLVQFVIEADGTIGPVEVIDDIKGCESCSNEAFRLVKEMPKWKPAVLQGKRVRSYVSVAIDFQ